MTNDLRDRIVALLPDGCDGCGGWVPSYDNAPGQTYGPERHPLDTGNGVHEFRDSRQALADRILKAVSSTREEPAP